MGSSGGSARTAFPFRFSQSRMRRSKRPEAETPAAADGGGARRPVRRLELIADVKGGAGEAVGSCEGTKERTHPTGRCGAQSGTDVLDNKVHPSLKSSHSLTSTSPARAPPSRALTALHPSAPTPTAHTCACAPPERRPPSPASAVPWRALRRRGGRRRLRKRGVPRSPTGTTRGDRDGLGPAARTPPPRRRHHFLGVEAERGRRAAREGAAALRFGSSWFRCVSAAGSNA